MKDTTTHTAMMKSNISLGFYFLSILTFMVLLSSLAFARADGLNGADQTNTRNNRSATGGNTVAPLRIEAQPLVIPQTSVALNNPNTIPRLQQPATQTIDYSRYRDAFNQTVSQRMGASYQQGYSSIVGGGSNFAGMGGGGSGGLNGTNGFSNMLGGARNLLNMANQFGIKTGNAGNIVNGLQIGSNVVSGIQGGAFGRLTGNLQTSGTNFLNTTSNAGIGNMGIFRPREGQTTSLFGGVNGNFNNNVNQLRRTPLTLAEYRPAEITASPLSLPTRNTITLAPGAPLVVNSPPVSQVRPVVSGSQ